MVAGVVVAVVIVVVKGAVVNGVDFETIPLDLVMATITTPTSM
jgi:hypothetical protein